MHILPTSVRQKLEDAGLSPPATEEEKLVWATEEKRYLRRARYRAAIIAAVIVGSAGVTKVIRHPEMSSAKLLATVGIGLLFYGLMFVIVLAQGSTDVAMERTKFIRARRLHRAILEEPDLEEESA